MIQLLIDHTFFNVNRHAYLDAEKFPTVAERSFILDNGQLLDALEGAYEGYDVIIG